MELTFNTQSVDVSVALKALNLYRAGEFQEAIGSLAEVVDAEPQNWQARLMMAVCYYKTNQNFAAQRGFRFIYDNSTDPESKKQALAGLHATNAKINKVGGLGLDGEEPEKPDWLE